MVKGITPIYMWKSDKRYMYHASRARYANADADENNR